MDRFRSLSYKTTVFYLLPKERMANLLSDNWYRVQVQPDGSLLCCPGADPTYGGYCLSNYPIQDRIYAGATLGFVQGFVGTKVDIASKESSGLENHLKRLDSKVDKENRL